MQSKYLPFAFVLFFAVLVVCGAYMEPPAGADFINALKAAHDTCGSDLTTPAGEYWCISKDGHTVYRMGEQDALEVMSQGSFTDIGYFKSMGVCVKGETEPVLWCNYHRGGQFEGRVKVQ
ncbi:MAG: hypothetical protein K0S79_74 [Nitrospira sp.]|jgi:hypothetical protein|nr:hypothetical protein [Nitrospira sp.]